MTETSIETTATPEVLMDYPAPFNELTPRELQVARRISVGLTNAEIADELDVSVKTVDTHAYKARMKARARNSVELARAMIRAGLTSLDEGAEKRCVR